MKSYIYLSKTIASIGLILSMLMQTVLASEAAFNKVCSSCHSGGFKGMVSGAPSINKPEDWIEYHKRHTPEQMIEIVLKGLNDHKVKGGCKKCSDEEIIGAVNFIVSSTKVEN